ncbi:MAG: DNA-directed RNA polymerase subunit omega [Planctomycetota bacterium]|jgi:DNA-directed RNA polymerase subunit K/omega
MNYKIDEFAKQVGGSLRLTSLIISRARQIIRKAPIFVDTKMDDPVQIALLELLQKKIKLSDGNVPPQISESKKAEKSL